MSNPLYDNIPLSENPLNPDSKISRPAALAKLMHVFNAGFELGVSGADKDAVLHSLFSFYKDSKANIQWCGAGFMYGAEGFTRDEAIKDYISFKEGGKCKLQKMLRGERDDNN